MGTRTKVTALVAALALTLVSARQSVAFSQAAYPTLGRGMRGYNVQAAQYLLRQREHRVSIDAVFGSAMDDAVRRFQRARGLSADGIIGPATWGKLIITVQRGSKGFAVRAVQSMLNQKRGTRLATDGVFGDATRNAVISFQRHAGISADGIVGPTTWRNILWHFQMIGGWTCGYGSSAERWATSESTFQLQKAANDFHETGNGKIAVGDASLEHGGNIAGHASHEVGMDVDLRPVRTDSSQCSAITRWDWSSYDRAATRRMIDLIRAKAPGRVKLILFNDPVLRREGRTTYWSGHDDHLHVRYCAPAHPSSLYRC